jgi:hypothetical protein
VPTARVLAATAANAIAMPALQEPNLLLHVDSTSPNLASSHSEALLASPRSVMSVHRTKKGCVEVVDK